MTITITALERSPDRGRGLARDMPVRWALEEVGQPYDVHLLSFAAIKQPAHRVLQPFGQIPTYQEQGNSNNDNDLALFESGAIVLHIAEHHGTTSPTPLLPLDAPGRARAITWMFAAVATIEPPIAARSHALIHERNQPWHEARMPALEAGVRLRLGELSARLGEAEWLEGGAFSAGDLMVVSVLRRLRASSGLLDEFPNLAAYVSRAEARPAFVRAFQAQLAVFEAAQAAERAEAECEVGK